jgi:hypothetical protein
MTDRAQFEAMLNALINEDQEAAKEIFHNIVVAKSREIYEELLSEDFDLNENTNPSEDKDMPYGDDDEEEEGFEPKADDSEEDDSDSEDDSEADDAEDDGEDTPDFDDEEGSEEGEGDMEDRVMDLEDALEELKAEFEQLLAGEEHEEEHNPDVHGGAMGDLPGMDGDHDVEADLVMEYVNKVATPHSKTVGSGNYENAGENNTTSTLSGRMKNNMGGTTANIAQGHQEVKGDAGARAGGTQGGLAKPTPQQIKSGNINVPGGKAGKTAFTHREPGHGAEKKGARPGEMVGAHTGDMGGMRGENNTQATIRPIKK